MICNKHIIYSFILAIFLTVVSYFINNLPIFTGENITELYFTQKICEYFHIDKPEQYNKAIFVDVSNCKSIAYEINGQDTIGTVTVTDRKKLYDFLLRLKTLDVEYKYIIMDIQFDKNCVTEYDDSLYSLMSNMERLVFASSDKDSLTVDCFGLKDKSAISTYYDTKIKNNFTRFQYVRTDKNNIDYYSIPLKIASDPSIKIDSISRIGRWRWLSKYVSKDKLCQNSIFLTFGNNKFEPQEYLYRLSSDINQGYDERLKSYDNTYIVLGDLQNDVHDTYVGERSGPLIIYRALQAIENGEHIVKGWLIAIWFFVYFIVSYSIINRKRTLHRFNRFFESRPNLRFLHFIVDSLSFTVFLWIIQIIEYSLLNSIHSIILPLFCFTTLRFYFQYKDYQNE